MTFNPKEHLSNVGGRPYMDVAHRLLWLNETAQQFMVATEIVDRTEDTATMRATVSVWGADGQQRQATAHASADRRQLRGPIAGRWLEKAETAAVGRALGMLGYGTQYAAEFDDATDDHLADSPAARPLQSGNSQEKPGVSPADLPRELEAALAPPQPTAMDQATFLKRCQDELNLKAVDFPRVLHGLTGSAYMKAMGLDLDQLYRVLECHVIDGVVAPEPAVAEEA